MDYRPPMAKPGLSRDKCSEVPDNQQSIKVHGLAMLPGPAGTRLLGRRPCTFISGSPSNKLLKSMARFQKSPSGRSPGSVPLKNEFCTASTLFRKNVSLRIQLESEVDLDDVEIEIEPARGRTPVPGRKHMKVELPTNKKSRSNCDQQQKRSTTTNTLPHQKVHFDNEKKNISSVIVVASTEEEQRCIQAFNALDLPSEVDRFPEKATTAVSSRGSEFGLFPDDEIDEDELISLAAAAEAQAQREVSVDVESVTPVPVLIGEIGQQCQQFEECKKETQNHSCTGSKYSFSSWHSSIAHSPLPELIDELAMIQLECLTELRECVKRACISLVRPSEMVLAVLAAELPASEKQLSAVPGMSMWQFSQFGELLLGITKKHSARKFLIYQSRCGSGVTTEEIKPTTATIPPPLRLL